MYMYVTGPKWSAFKETMFKCHHIVFTWNQYVQFVIYHPRMNWIVLIALVAYIEALDTVNPLFLKSLILFQRDLVDNDHNDHEISNNRLPNGASRGRTVLQSLQEKPGRVSTMDADFRGEVQAASHEDTEVYVFDDVHV